MTMNYRELQQFIKGLPINGRYRCDCPVCGNKNTFSVVQDGLEIFYNCFHINCNTKGVMQGDLTLDKLNDSISSICKSTSTTRQNIPELGFSKLNADCDKYLRTFGIGDRTETLAYDPKQHRLVFPLEYQGENYGYVGRALNANI